MDEIETVLILHLLVQPLAVPTRRIPFSRMVVAVILYLLQEDDLLIRLARISTSIPVTNTLAV
jgi:hypothetical protein